MASTPDSVTAEYVRSIFSDLENRGGGAAFLNNVHPEVHWTVKGTHPLAGVYRDRQSFQEGVLAKVAAGLTAPIKMKVTNVLVCGDWAIVELFADGDVAKAGWRFDNNHCWVCHFEKGIITEVRAYLDSAMVARLIQEADSGM